MQYPSTRKESITEEIFGVKISDPYRWLEDDHSEETQAWVLEQQALTESMLNEYPDRKSILNRFKELYDYERQGCPLKRGNWYYFAKNDGLQNQYVTYRKRTLDSEAELFFDPNTLSDDGTTTAQVVGRSKDNQYFVYMISKAGADAGEFWIMETETKTFHEDKLLNIRQTGAAWYKSGYFYSRYDEDEDYQKQNKNQKIYYHKLGDVKENDTLIFEDLEHPLRYNFAHVSDDEKYLIIHTSEGTQGNSLSYKNLEDDNSEIQCIFEGFEYNAGIIDAYEKDNFYLFTNKNAKNYKLFMVNLTNPEEHNWIEVIPERDYLLDTVEIVGEKIIAFFIKDVQSHIEVLDLNGKFLNEIKMPYQGTAQIVYAKKEDREGFMYFSSYIRPDEMYHYDIPNNKLDFYYTYPIKADVKDIVSEQIYFPSKDGTHIPMTLIYKRGMEKNKNNPVYLYGYGGFNVSMLPYFSEDRILYLEKGGIYVVANLRGGGEYGETWHEQGMLFKK